MKPRENFNLKEGNVQQLNEDDQDKKIHKDLAEFDVSGQSSDNDLESDLTRPKRQLFQHKKKIKKGVSRLYQIACITACNYHVPFLACTFLFTWFEKQ